MALWKKGKLLAYIFIKAMKTKCVCLAALSTYIQTGFPMHFSAVSQNPYYKQVPQVLTDLSEVLSFPFLEKEHGF